MDLFQNYNVNQNLKTMKKLISIILLIALSQIVFAQYNIGHTTITFQDPARSNRNIQTEIYYPGQTSGTNVAAVQGSFPVIVFGHGFVMSWDAYQNLWEEFVPRGYIMAFPRTEGNIISTNHQEFGWDLQFLVTEMQAEGADASSILYNVVAPETALMGHSMGGGAAFLAADSLCNNGNINLKTLIGLAPAESTTNGVSSIGSAASITIPSVVLSGTQDGVTPPGDHHIPMYNALASSCKTIINIIGGGHCYFANSNFNCDFGETTSSTGISITRLEQHAITFDFVNLWLDYTLKNNCDSYFVFEDSLTNSTRVSFSQVCTSGPIPINTSVSINANTLSVDQPGASFQWIDCDNGNQPINGENNNSFTASTSGNYAVIITLGNCSETSACTYVNVVEKENISLINSIKPFPNPSEGVITFDVLTAVELVIINSQGKIVENRSIKQGQNILRLDLAKGLYYWEYNLNGRIINSGKIIFN